jgi:outer membrane receptor protein involved in Fe transport
LHKAIKAFDASLVFTTVGAMNGPKAEVDDYNTLDLNLGYTHKIKSVRFRHALAFVNLFDEDVVIPQYVARPSNSVNEMPLGPSRGIYYSLAVSF